MTRWVNGLPAVHQVLVMTVEPGFGGQKFNPAAAAKCAVLRHKYPALQIEVTALVVADLLCIVRMPACRRTSLHPWCACVLLQGCGWGSGEEANSQPQVQALLPDLLVCSVAPGWVVQRCASR
jgi:hypothetical protein